MTRVERAAKIERCCNIGRKSEKEIELEDDAGVRFVKTIFGRDAQLESERFMAQCRL